MFRLFFRNLLISTLLAFAAAGIALAQGGGSEATMNAQEAADFAQSSQGKAGAASSYKWQAGPLIVTIMDQLTMKIPKGYAFLEEKEAQRVLRRLGNPNVRNVMGVITDSGRDWICVVRLEKVGYIKDDSAKSMDADKLLESIKKATEKSNALRAQNKVATLDIMGWMEKPRYDDKAKLLTLALAVRDKDSFELDRQGINYNTYMLGREAYFSLNLITPLSRIGKNKAHLTTLLAGTSFKTGKKYSDFKSGDKQARFELTQLAAGTVPTRKTGFRGTIQDFFEDYGMLLLWLLIIALVGTGGYFGWRFWQSRRPPPPLLDEPVEPSAGDEPGKGATETPKT